MFIDGAPFGPVSALCAPALQLGRAAAAAMADRGRRALPMENRLCNARCVKNPTARQQTRQGAPMLALPGEMCASSCAPRAAAPRALRRHPRAEGHGYNVESRCRRRWTRGAFRGRRIRARLDAFSRHASCVPKARLCCSEAQAALSCPNAATQAAGAARARLRD